MHPLGFRRLSEGNVRRNAMDLPGQLRLVQGAAPGNTHPAHLVVPMHGPNLNVDRLVLVQAAAEGQLYGVAIVRMNGRKEPVDRPARLGLLPCCVQRQVEESPHALRTSYLHAIRIKLPSTEFRRINCKFPSRLGKPEPKGSESPLFASSSGDIPRDLKGEPPRKGKARDPTRDEGVQRP